MYAIPYLNSNSHSLRVLSLNEGNIQSHDLYKINIYLLCTKNNLTETCLVTTFIHFALPPCLGYYF